MEYVYRYLNASGVTVYVGITNDMKRRVAQHKTDKLSNIRNGKVEFFGVENRTDADLLETYLINHFKTGNYYNVSKANRGDVSFLDGVEFPWTEYVDGAEPITFNVKSPVKVVEKKVVYRKQGDSVTATIDAMQRQIHNEHCWIRHIREKEIPACERDIVNANDGLKSIDENEESLMTEFREYYAKELQKLGATKQEPVVSEKEFCEMCLEEEKNNLRKAKEMWEKRISLLREYADCLEKGLNFRFDSESDVGVWRAKAKYLDAIINKQVDEINKFHREKFCIDYDILTDRSSDLS